jgi:prevent-host-death family protein
MMKTEWALQDAKNRFSEVVDKAISNGPQLVTRRGRECVVIISTRDYRRSQKKKQNLVDYFQSSPLKQVDLQLERDKAPIRDLAI